MTITPLISRRGLTRRHVMGAALAVGVAVPLSGVGVADSGWAGPAASAS